MLDHHIQCSIVYHLAFLERARFSDLKPDDVENKLFTYHLKKVVQAGLVSKDGDGLYSLTPEGRRLGFNVYEEHPEQLNQAISMLFLVVRRQSDNNWLLYRRKSHPLLNRVGFMHAVPNVHEPVAATAQKTLRANTGLSGSFTARGSGYFRVYDKTNLESFTHFTLMVCDDATGDLIQKDERAEYWWQDQPDFSAPEMLPNMQLLYEAYETGDPFFLEKTLQA